MEYNIVHNEGQNRFETEVEGQLALVDYIRRGNVLWVTHTGVPRPLEGRGIAAALTKTLLDYARENHYKIHPLCSYTRAYILRNKEYQDLIE